MSRIQFERRKRKKNYLIPLIIIVLLYFIIPIYLINKGSGLVNLASSKMNNSDVYGPPVEFYNGIAFLNTAAAFPGFGKWSENIMESSVNNMLKYKTGQFNKLCVGILKTKRNIENLISDTVEITYNAKNKPIVLSIKTVPSDSSFINTITLNDSLLNFIDSTYCKPWEQFFDKTKLDKSKIHQFCKY